MDLAASIEVAQQVMLVVWSFFLVFMKRSQALCSLRCGATLDNLDQTRDVRLFIGQYGQFEMLPLLSVGCIAMNQQAQRNQGFWLLIADDDDAFRPTTNRQQHWQQ